MSNFGVSLDINVNKINTKFKCELKKRGGIGIKSLGRIFRRMDENGNKMLDMGEFEEALAVYGYARSHL
jgi:hypothetical protein